MYKCTFIHDLDISSTHMDEGGSYTVVKIASALVLIIEKKITGSERRDGSLAAMLLTRTLFLPSPHRAGHRQPSKHMMMMVMPVSAAPWD
jgi:hypothetical protein